LVYDPAFSDIPRYFDAEMPYSYKISNNGTHVVAYNGTTHKIDYGPSTNASYVIQTCWNLLALGNGGTISLKIGIYESIDLLMWDDSTYGGRKISSVALVGETIPSQRGVVFRGSSDTMIRSNNTQYPTGAWGAYHSIENILFEHTTPNDDAVTLDFWYLQPELDNIVCSNKNATRQGMAIRYGSGMGVTGQNLVTCEDVSVGYYGVGMNVSADHVVFVNPSIYGCDDFGLWWGDSCWSSFVNLQIILPDGTCNQSYPIYLNHLGQGNTIFDVNIEGSATTLERPFITVKGIAGWKPLQIFGFYSDVALDTGVPFWNRTDTGGGAEYWVEAHSGTYRSGKGQLVTVSDGEWVTHGLLAQPYYCHATVEDDLLKEAGVCHIVSVSAKNATHVQISVKHATDGSSHAGDDIEVYVLCDVNRA